MADDILSDFTEYDDLSIEKILTNLLTPENIELKTEVESPSALAGLKLIQKYLDDIGLKESSELIREYVETLLRLMVSYNRQGRKEIIEAVKGLVEEKRTTPFDKLTKNLSEV